jgi:hypothetical protein
MLTPGTAGMMLDGASDNANEDPDAALSILHTHTVDALNGFVKMVEKAEPEFRAVAQRSMTFMRGMRANWRIT